MKSPGSMYAFSPATAVYVSLPSMMKRSAAAVCLCARANSPGMIS